ncbi:hypothetical protein ACTFIR_009762 [Dictyostelium discoideum]
MFPQVLGTFQEVLTKQSVGSIPIQIQQFWKLRIIQTFQSHLMSIIRIQKSSYPQVHIHCASKENTCTMKIFGLARSSDLVKWSFNGLIITPDSIKGPVIKAKEQRKCVVSILELTSLDNTNSQVCPVRHLATYIRASKGKTRVMILTSSNFTLPVGGLSLGLLVEEANHKVATCGSNTKKSVNSSGNNTTGNSSNSKSSSGSNGRSNNFNGSPSNVASGSNNTKSANEEQEVNLPVGGRLFHHKQVWKELGLPNFCQEVVNGLKVHLLPNFKPMPNPILFSIPEGPKSDCITKEVQDLLLDDAIEQVKYLHQQPIIQDGRNKESTIDGKTRLLHGKTRYQESLPSRISRSTIQRLIPLRGKDHITVGKQSPRIFSMLLRPVLRMLRDINVSVIAYLDNLLIVGSTKEECLSNLKNTMDLLVKLDFKLNLEKSVLEPTQSITFLGLQIDSVSMKLLVPKEKKKSVIKEIRNFLKLDCCSPRKLAGLKGKIIALKDAVIPFRLYTRQTNKFHSQCLTLANGDWDQSFPIPQDVKSEISHWLTVLNQWNGKEISLFPSYHYVLTTDASESGAGATLKKGNKTIKTWSFQWSTTQSNMSSNRREMLALLMAYQALWWSDTGSISSVRTTLETMPQEESQLDWRAYSRILQCKRRPPQPSSYTRFRNFCSSNFLNPANITLIVFLDYLTHLFKHKPPLAFSTINGHRSMLNQLLLLKNQTDIVNDPFITRIMTGIHKLRPSSAKYQEIWDANQVFKHLSTIKVIPKYTYTALLKKTLLLCKMFGIARSSSLTSSDLVKWSFNGLIITPDSIKGPVINAKEQRKGLLSILELTSLDDTNSQVCPVRHLSTYLRASKGRRKHHSGDSVFIQNEGKPLDVKDINIIVLSTLSSSGIDISKFKSHSTRSAMASLLLSNNVPFHVVKKMGRWKSNDTVDTFYDKRIIGEKSGGFLNTVVQIS